VNNTYSLEVEANKLKAVFNTLWDQALKMNKKQGNTEVLSYRDMVRISDAIRMEGPGVIGLESLPKQIDAGLFFAISAVDPNEVRSKENLKNGFSAVSGASGLALVSICLGQLINPGVWALVAAFFAGGIAGGPLAIVGVAGGLLLITMAVYKSFEEMSPIERAKKSHEFVMNGIDQWVKDNTSSANQPKKIFKSQKKPSLINKLNNLIDDTIEQPITAVSALIDGAEKAHDYITSEIDNLTGNSTNSPIKPIKPHETQEDIPSDEKFGELVNGLSERHIAAAGVLMQRVALADGVFHGKEKDYINMITSGINHPDLDNKMGVSIDVLNQLSNPQKREIVSWCFGVARSDGEFHVNEQREIQTMCEKLGLNYKALQMLY
jgi:uncharacterized tellurite resistance protein B-like protein